MKVATFLAFVATPAVFAQVALYGQCGGKYYSGTTSCASGLDCKYVNEWYSQCVVGAVSPSPSPAPSSPSPSPSPSPKSPSPSPSPSPKTSPSPSPVSYCTAQGGQDTARVAGSKPRVVSKCLKPGQFALTFDDGPKQYEPQLLSKLSNYGIKATFFITSNLYVDARQSPYSGWIKDLYNAGHQIAQHTSQHKDLTSISSSEVQTQLSDCENVIYNIIGKRPAMMRPPQGKTSDSVNSIIEKQGIQTVVLWNTDSGDWSNHNAQTSFQNVKSALDKCPNGSGSIVVLSHSTEASVLDYVDLVVPYVKSKGYTFVTMAECVGMPAYK
ncbi:hypothetical protein HK098_000274 [Nowakowskiella sp. JEL0407]|nr:hypothetical protein HK098_000274 [Nowakowskiella sp. JEL0407]